MSARVIFDCMVFLQAAARPQRVHGCFQALGHPEVTLLLSPDVVSEIRDVLTRPELRAKFPALSREAVNTFVVHWLERSEFVVSVPRVASLPRDPKDEKYLDLAAAAQATHLVTRDRDLLDLPDSGSAECRFLRDYCPGLRVVTPEDFATEFPQPPGRTNPGT